MPKAIPDSIKITESAHQNTAVTSTGEEAASAVIKAGKISRTVRIPVTPVARPSRLKSMHMVAIPASKTG